MTIRSFQTVDKVSHKSVGLSLFPSQGFFILKTGSRFQDDIFKGFFHPDLGYPISG